MLRGGGRGESGPSGRGRGGGEKGGPAPPQEVPLLLPQEQAQMLLVPDHVVLERENQVSQGRVHRVVVEMFLTRHKPEGEITKLYCS